MDRNIENNIKDLYRKKATKVKVYLKASNSVGTNYDPFRSVGKTTTLQNPKYIKAIVRDVSPNKLIIKELGLSEMGAKELIIHKQDLNAIKISDKIVIDGNEYIKYHKALGSNFAIWKRSFDFYRVIIFRKGE